MNMEKDSTIYKYGCSEIPYQLLDMLSATAYKAFGKIYQCIATNCRDMRDGVEIPAAIFEGVVGDHHATIKKINRRINKLWYCISTKT